MRNWGHFSLTLETQFHIPTGQHNKRDISLLSIYWLGCGITSGGGHCVRSAALNALVGKDKEYRLRGTCKLNPKKTIAHDDVT